MKESFSSFFKNSTPNTREHQQNPIRSMNRKHLNQVPYSKGQQAQDPLVDRIIKNNQYGKWPNISYITGKRIAKTYHITHTEDKPYNNKSINRTGITLSYNPETKKFTLERLKQK
jgi:hypothetical protein